MCKIKLVFILKLMLMCIIDINAQQIQWQNTIGGNDYDWLSSVQQTNDGGYILGGYSNSDISGDKNENNLGPSSTRDYWIVKTDSNGNILWQNTIGGSNWDELRYVQQTTDSGFVLAGFSNSNISGDKIENNISFPISTRADYWIVKTDVLGNIQWQNTIGGDNVDELTCVEQTSDGGYIIGGNSNSGPTILVPGDKTESNINNSIDYWILKLDAIGNIQWQNTIGGNSSDVLTCIHQTSDDGFILGGISMSDATFDKTENCLGFFDYWIVKTDLTGNIEWENTIGGAKSDELYAIEQTADGGYIIGGYSKSDSSSDKSQNNWDTTLVTPDYWIVKTDSTGNILWDKTIGGTKSDVFYSLKPTFDSGYILAGWSTSNISGDKTENALFNITCCSPDQWVVKTDSIGSIQWQNTIGGHDDDRLTSVQQTSDGGYILGGVSQSDISGDKTENNIGGYDYWIVKLNDTTITSLQSTLSAQSPLNVFPNPTTQQITINGVILNNGNASIYLYDVTGRILINSIQPSAATSFKMDISNYPKGIYFLEITNGNEKRQRSRIVKL